MEKYIVRLLSRDSVDSQVNVYKEAFKSTSRIEMIKTQWEAKHFMNPIHESFVFGVYDGELLVSINAYMPMRYHFNGQEVNILQSCESGTLPEYQGKGIWSMVVNHAVNYFVHDGFYDAIIGFPNYENSFGGFMKMKWNHNGDVNNYIYIVNGKSFLNTVAYMNYPIGKLCEIQKLFLKRNTKGYTIRENSYNFSSPIDPIFNLEVSKEFIEWKHNYKKLTSFTIYKNNVYKGSCAFSTSSYKGKLAIILHRIDVSEKEDTKKVFSFAIKEIIKRHPNAIFIRYWAMPNSYGEKNVKSIGFIKVNHHNPFITYHLKQGTISVEELQNINNWQNISLLDLD